MISYNAKRFGMKLATSMKRFDPLAYLLDGLSTVPIAKETATTGENG